MYIKLFNIANCGFVNYMFYLHTNSDSFLSVYLHTNSDSLV